MGYFGGNILDNDKAMDWLDATSSRSSSRRIEASIKSYISWSGRNGRRFSQDDIEEMVERAIRHDRKYPPSHWKGMNRPTEELIQESALRYREHLESGRYLDEEYGPAEEALAAAYLVKEWGGARARKEVSTLEDCERLVLALSKKPLPLELLDLAIAAVEKALACERYQRMRGLYLQSFPEITRNDDQMMAVNDLLASLRALLKERDAMAERL